MNILDALKAMNSADLQSGMASMFTSAKKVSDDVAAIRAELDAARAGFAQMAAYIKSEFDGIRAEQHRLAELLAQLLPPSGESPAQLNGGRLQLTAPETPHGVNGRSLEPGAYDD